jgi:hypothetical protein
MKKEKRIFMEMLFPGSFFPESNTKQVESADIPKSIPMDCYGFSFSETEYVIDGKNEYAGETKKLGKTYIIGEAVPLDKIPDMIDGRDTRILKGNIDCNSPTKTAIKTHMGTWQMEDGYHTSISPNRFKFDPPLMYKNFKK